MAMEGKGVADKLDEGWNILPVWDAGMLGWGLSIREGWRGERRGFEN